MIETFLVQEIQYADSFLHTGLSLILAIIYSSFVSNLSLSCLEDSPFTLMYLIHFLISWAHLD
jgi:hypothetical protein